MDWDLQIEKYKIASLRKDLDKTLN